RLPFSIRVLLEAAARNCDEFLVKKEDVESILNWKVTQQQSVEVPFRPARVILQGFTGMPAEVDFAVMRDAVKKLGGDPEKISPVCPADLVIDHSIHVDFNRKTESLQKNEELEFERNKERFEFLKVDFCLLKYTVYVWAVVHKAAIASSSWGSKAFRNMRIIPPGSGIVHQVKLEYLVKVVRLDLSTVVPCCSGPKRPQNKVVVSEMKKDFESCLGAKQGFKGFQIAPERHAAKVNFKYDGQEFVLSHGSVVIAAITSCTNTSNPSVMLGAGLLAKKAIEAGLSVKPYVKTSLSPGSGVVTYYLKESGVMPFLSQLGFEVVGYGCMTCIGNSGPIPETVVQAITKTVNERWNDLKAPSDELYTWDPKSTYITPPPFFESLLDVFDAAERYQKAGPLIILAGKEYG
ncbi:UNVERIFIED_CONTAM: hypothetical protein FKN15_032713, partial [Acipenser sinensis]